jgi:hypothetical protein
MSKSIKLGGRHEQVERPTAEDVSMGEAGAVKAAAETPQFQPAPEVTTPESGKRSPAPKNGARLSWPDPEAGSGSSGY